MHKIIDVPMDVSAFAEQLAQAGVQTVIRYYNNRNSSGLPSKCLTAAEAKTLDDAGMSIAVVFQQRGGAGGNIDDLSGRNGARDAKRALLLARRIGQPSGSTIYFAVDHDYFRNSELNKISPYFENAQAELGGRYKMGTYGSGTVGKYMKSRSLVEHIWLAGARGWSGTRQMLQTDEWSLFQKDLHKTSPIGGFGYDGNVANPTFENFGQFSLGAEAVLSPLAAPTAIMRVTARSGLNLRSGPGENFQVITLLPMDSLVTAVDADGRWVKVDIEGDGNIDGFMAGEFLEAVSGGLPEEPPSGATPYEVARAEFRRDIREIRGPRNNPRIVMYHATTRGGPAPDETAWCSSFVNYCVELVGMIGTKSKWARSWHDSAWGQETTGGPEKGDIVVWRRRGDEVDGGHVAFFEEDQGDQIKVLGGNQGNAISVTSYPKNGDKGSFHYELLSIRRS